MQFLKKTIAISILFIFLISTASATNVKKIGYDNGYKNGNVDGIKSGEYDCVKYGKSPVLTKISAVFLFPIWSITYQNSYKSGYIAGFVTGYNYSRFICTGI